MLGLIGWGAAGLVCGCGQKKKPGEIVFWHEDASEKQMEVMRRQLVLFGQKHPDIVVQANAVQYRYLREKIQGALMSNSLPDVLALNSYWTREPKLRAQLARLDEGWIDEKMARELAADIRTHDLNRGRIKGGLFSLPLASAYGGLMCVYNVNVLERLGLDGMFQPKNWAEFTEFSREVVERANPGKTIEVAALDPFLVHGILLQIVLTHGAGGMAVSRDGKQARYLSAEMRRSLEAIDLYVNTVYKKFGGYSGLLQWRNNVGAGITTIVARFIHGKAAFCAMGTGLLNELVAPELAGCFRADLIPGLERRHGAIAAHALSCAMNRKSANPRAAWELLRYLTVDPAGNGEVSVKLLRPCPINAINTRPEYAVLGPLWRQAQAVMAEDMSFEVSSFSEFLAPLAEDVPFRRLRGDSLEAILTDMNTLVQRVLNETNQSS